MLLFLGITLTFLPVSASDMIPPLGDGEEKLITEKMDDKTISQLVDSFVARAEKAYTEKYTPPEGFLEWLKSVPLLRAAFGLAINPDYDNVGKAMEVLDQLRKSDAKSVERFYHLAVAFAVVWDSPGAIESSRHACIHGMTPDQFEPLPKLLDNFKCFTNPENLNIFNTIPDKLTWPFLVQIVDMDLSPEEIEWALKNYRSRGKLVYSFYDSIQYDYDKYFGVTSKLGNNKYNLQNLLKYGGVCGDQAHFASRMAKLFMTPAMKVAGTGRYGEGHAWLGFMNMKGNKAELDFTGRYFFDYYYTGEIFDPQTGTNILDSELAMQYEGINLGYNKYINSLILTRMAQALISDKPEISLKLAINALQQNMFYSPAWETVVQHIKNDTLKPAQGVIWLNQMTTSLKKYPDKIMSCLVDFMKCIPKDDYKKRDGVYQSITQIVKTAKRPDLLMRLSLVLGEELCVRGEEAKALSLYLETAQANAIEGNLILPLLDRGMELSRKLNKTKETIALYEKIIQKMPHYRDDKISKSFQDAARMLVYLCNDVAMNDKAEKLKKVACLDDKVIAVAQIDKTNKKKQEKTMAELNDYIKKNLKSALAHNELGEAHSLKGDIEKALAEFSEAIKLNPKFEEAYNNRADLYSTIGDFAKAIPDYTKAIELNPKNAIAYNNRGFAYFNDKEWFNDKEEPTNKGEDGSTIIIKGVNRETLEKMRTYPSKAINDYNEAIRLNPQYALAYNNRGIATQSIEDFTEAIKCNPNYYEAYFNRGCFYDYKGEEDKAFADYSEAIKLNQNYAQAYVARGDIYRWGKRDYVNAVNDYTEAIRTDPNYTKAYIKRGGNYLNKREFDKAVYDFSEAIRLSPKDDQGYFYRGWAYYDKCEFAKAIVDYTEAIRLCPSFYQTYEKRALAYYKNNEFDKAIVDCNEAIKRNLRSSSIYSNRGDAYAKKGDFDKAIDDYNEAITKFPQCFSAFLGRGEVYYEKNEFDKALSDLEQCLKIASNQRLATLPDFKEAVSHARELFEKTKEKLGGQNK
jgi:tetratricopeptide (TPR) repeat protein